MLGEGCEQIERVLQRHFPDARLLRIDRDTTHTRTQWSEHLERIHQGDVDIIIGTQMLAKGHHFSNVTLSVILDTDARLHATHLDAIEGLGQLITQVAGRSGREQKKHEPGEVLIQTAFTEHPLLQRVLQEGYAAFAQHLLKERKQWKLPPYQHELTLTAQAKTMPEAIAWLQKVKHAFEQQQLPLTVYGPMPHGMPKRAGWFRAQLTLQSTHRAALHRAMAHWLPLNEPQPVRRRHEQPNTSPFQPTQAPREQAVRWFVDV